MSPSTNSENDLVVEFLGEEHRVDTERRFTFGRTGDLEVDDNPYMHRVVGRFRFDEGLWWIDNTGSAITLEIADRTTPSRMKLAPGSSASLSFEKSVIRFPAAATTYEIEVTIPSPDRTPVEDLTNDLGDDTVTVSVLGVSLTDDQRRCIVSLAKARLEDPGAPATVPTNRSAAALLGWKITRFNRKLDNVCDRLADAGVAGLRGDASGMATNRRQRLVDYSISSGLVTAADLELLPH